METRALVFGSLQNTHLNSQIAGEYPGHNIRLGSTMNKGIELISIH
jgi:hypothetical protein